ncbi:MAG: hypothetical protein ACXW5U_30490 [Thermoanaerobaculia bacterium]
MYAWVRGMISWWKNGGRRGRRGCSNRSRTLFAEDRRNGVPGVWLPHALEKQ